MSDAKPKTESQKALEKLGLRRDIDLALHLPLRYEDETRIVKLRDVRDNTPVQIEATVTHQEVTYRPRKQLIVTVDDGSDTCTLRFFSFYGSQQKALAVGNTVRVRGEVKGGFLGRTMLHPSVKAAGGDLPTALTPVYPTVAGLPQAYLRKAVLSGLARADLSDTFAPGDLEWLQHRQKHQNGPQPLWSLREALQFLHHPTPDVSLDTLMDHSHPAWQRLKAEELLAQQLSQLQSRRERAALRAPQLRATEGNSLHARLLAALPFALTKAQQRVGEEIAKDMARRIPMHRLLQGDVGAGKTVVAALAAAICMDAGWQCALMAPTEILAEQHFRKLLGWLEPLGITTAWLTGTQKAKERRAMLALIASGEAQLVVGTHAIIQDKVKFKKLALAIIDEQHRFGVAQRLALRKKMTVTQGELDASQGHHGTGSGEPQGAAPLQGEAAARSEQATGVEPHLLMMTATPIPRTLAMSYYADLDVSTLDELPPGRTPIVTKVVNDARRDEVIERIRAQISQGRQVYWVCPLIEESEALDLTNATQTHAYLAEALQGVQRAAGPPQGTLAPSGGSDPQSGGAWGRQTAAGPPQGTLAPSGGSDPQSGGACGRQTTDGQPVLIGLLHSRMHAEDKKAVMQAFTAGRMSVLVSTTVIEVGVDVPNASLMVIEHAERFGLSQLHQLRGRVGRGAAASACVLLYSTGDAPRLGEAARERLKAMVETNDGFEIARRDLEIRGPGEFLGARQSGEAMLRFADLATDTELLNWAKAEAPMLLDTYPHLAAKHVARWLGGKAEYLKA